MMPLPPEAFLHQLADIADTETLPRFRRPLDVSAKDKPGWRFDPVTEVDRAAERALGAHIAASYPDHAIFGEELGEMGVGSCRWVLDPVDGTRPFLCGLPVWTTLIGFTVEDRAVMGVISQPFTGERFWATGVGAWGQRVGSGRYALQTRDVGVLSNAIVHTTSPEGFDEAGRAGLDRLMGAVQMTRFGGESYATAMLAAGHIDLCLEPSLQPHDIVAPIPIIEHAGGIVTRLDGGRAEVGGAVLASATTALHEQALAILAGRGVKA